MKTSTMFLVAYSDDTGTDLFFYSTEVLAYKGAAKIIVDLVNDEDQFRIGVDGDSRIPKLRKFITSGSYVAAVDLWNEISDCWYDAKNLSVSSGDMITEVEIEDFR